MFAVPVATALLLLLVACSQPPPLVSTTVPGPFVAQPTPMPTVAADQGWAPAPRTKTAGCASVNGLPDPACTPGAVDPRVTQASIGTTICTRGYTRTVRPPVNVTEPIKRQEMAAYGLTGQPLAAEELDDLIALELGGAPQDVANVA